MLKDCRPAFEESGLTIEYLKWRKKIMKQKLH